jgi:aquaporin Z
MQAAAHQSQNASRQAVFASFLKHWPEYLMEAAGLGIFMISACVFGVLLEHPSSPLNEALVGHDLLRRAVGGLAMGLTAVSIICSPWGQRSGAHLNPAVTLTFLSLRKVAAVDAAFYVLFQFLGGAAGVFIARFLIGQPLQHASVNYVATVPGPRGPLLAFLGEFLISTILMTTVLSVSNSKHWSRFTPLFAGALVATFITFEAPLSGMSMNPARTFGSAFHADEWTGLWIYFVAPISAMLLAALLYRLRHGAHNVFCAKLHHHNHQPCIFCCRYGELNAQ